MTVVTPPRQPRPTDRVERDDLAALIEEARRHARRRRRLQAAAAGIVALVAIGVIAVESALDSRSASGAPSSTALGASAPKIAFLRGVPNRRAELWVMSADGTGQRRIGGPATAVWSPDGARIAFHRSSGGPGGHRTPDIFVMNADGTGVRRLTDNALFDAGPTWSPDGKRIAFTTFRHDDDNFEIYVMNADGSGQRNLTNDRARDRDPVWSPDGKSIAFLRSMDGRLPDIFVMNADGTGQRRVARRGWFPVWSPDSRRIAYQQRDGDLHLVAADGGPARNLTRSRGTDLLPVWSPDGSRSRS